MKTLRQAWQRLARSLSLRRSHASPWEGHAMVRDQTWRLTDRLVAALAALMASRRSARQPFQKMLYCRAGGVYSTPLKLRSAASLPGMSEE